MRVRVERRETQMELQEEIRKARLIERQRQIHELQRGDRGVTVEESIMRNERLKRERMHLGLEKTDPNRPIY